MIKFSNWLETHSVQQVAGNARGDRKDLGGQGFEGLQDAMDALKVAAKDPKNSSAMNSIFGRLSALVSREDPDLATRLGSSARKFVSMSKNAAQPLGNDAGAMQNNQIQR